MKRIDFRADVLPLKDSLFRLALRITLDRDEAEDIVQETLIKVWEERDQWHQIQSIEAYATTICRRLALDNVRKEILQTGKEQDIADYQLSIVNSYNAPDERLHQRERLEIVHKLMDGLPEVQRSIMLLRDTEELKYDEIAQRLELTETQVKVYLHRARTRIKNELEKIEQYGL